MNTKEQIKQMLMWLESIHIEEEKSKKRSKFISIGIKIESVTLSKVKAYILNEKIGLGEFINIVLTEWVKQKEECEGELKMINPKTRVPHRRPATPDEKLSALKDRVLKELAILAKDLNEAI